MSHPILVHRYHWARSLPSVDVKRSPISAVAQAKISSLHITITVLAVVIVVAGLPMVLGYLWILYQRRMRQHQRHDSSQSIGLRILDSNVGIDVHYSPCAREDVEQPRDLESRLSVETVLSPNSPNQGLLQPELQLTRPSPPPTINILGRRGRTRLTCDTRARYTIDAVLTPSMVRSCPPQVLQIPPLFGFDEATITPPVGSPLWRSQAPDSAGIPDSPRRIVRHHVSQGPVTSFADLIMLRPKAAVREVQGV